jgi:hypothetical protein
MADDDAIDLLPPLYAVALRLAQAGAEPALIAAATGIELESVPAFLLVAHAKLDELSPSSSRGHRPPRSR